MNAAELKKAEVTTQLATIRVYVKGLVEALRRAETALVAGDTEQAEDDLGDAACEADRAKQECRDLIDELPVVE